jgi:hypothetical protein
LDLDSYRSYKYIAIEHGLTGRILSWRMPDDRTFYPIPFPVTLSFTDRSTWFFLQPPQAADPPRSPTPVQVHTPSHHDEDVEMEDAHTSPQQMHTSPPTAAGPSPQHMHTSPTTAAGPSHHHASTSTAAGAHTPPRDPTLRDLYRMISAMQATQLDILSTQSHIQHAMREQADELADMRMDLTSQSSRIRTIEEQIRDWRFFQQHGHWPPAPAPAPAPPPPPPQ